MAKSNWDKMKERFDKNCPFTPEFIEHAAEFRKRYEAGEFDNTDGGLTPEQRADLERRGRKGEELRKKYEGVGTIFSRDNYVIEGGDVDD